jgi:hypothetical protein
MAGLKAPVVGKRPNAPVTRPLFGTQVLFDVHTSAPLRLQLHCLRYFRLRSRNVRFPVVVMYSPGTSVGRSLSPVARVNISIVCPLGMERRCIKMMQASPRGPIASNFSVSIGAFCFAATVEQPLCARRGSGQPPLHETAVPSLVAWPLQAEGRYAGEAAFQLATAATALAALQSSV